MNVNAKAIIKLFDSLRQLKGYEYLAQIDLDHYLPNLQEVLIQNRIIYSELCELTIENLQAIPLPVIGIDEHNDLLLINQDEVINCSKDLSSKSYHNHMIPKAYILQSKLAIKNFNVKFLLLRLYDQLSPHMPKIFIYNFINNILLILTSLISSYVINIAIPMGELQTFYIMFVIFTLTASIFSLFQLLERILIFKISSHIDLLWYKSILSNIVKQDYIKDSGNATGRVSDFLDAIDKLQDFVLRCGSYIISLPLLILAMLSFSPSWTLLYIITALIISISIFIISPLLIKINSNYYKYEGKFNNSLTDFLSAIEKIKTTNNESKIIKIISSIFVDKEQANYKHKDAYLFYNIFLLLFMSMNMIIFYFLIHHYHRNEEASAIIPFSILASQFMMNINSFAYNIINIKILTPIVNRMEQLIHHTDISQENCKRTILYKPKGNITISNLSFQYNVNTNSLLNSINFEVNSGEFIQIKGESGCGKTTLLKLLLGIYVNFTGKIFYDDIEIKSLDTQYLRRNIGVVMQNDSLFPGTIYQNLTLGLAEKVSQEKIWTIAEHIDIAKDIQNMPLGFNTIINTDCNVLSGGQRQKLLLMRALLKKPKILILDEVTRAFDVVTQSKILNYLKELDATKIIISHNYNIHKYIDRTIKIDGSVACKL